MEKKKMMRLVVNLILGLFFFNFSFAETIVLKSGKVVEEKIVERTDEYIKVDLFGVPLTYYLDEIESIDGESVVLTLSKEEVQPQYGISPYITDEDVNAADIYRKAGSKLTELPEDFRDKADKVIKNGWVGGNEELKEILMKNKEAISEFKKATMQRSDGFAFSKRPQKLDATTILLDCRDELNLFRLLLLEGMMHETEKEHVQAGEDYLSATRFILHLSQQKFSILISTMAEIICLDVAYPCLGQNIQNRAFDKEYYKKLLDNLLLIKNNQDFLKNALEEEAEVLKSFMRQIEEAAKKGVSYDELSAMIMMDNTIEMQYREDRKKIEEINMMLDSEFFSEFYRIVSGIVDDFTKTAIFSARENNPEIYEKKISDFSASIKKQRYLLDYVEEKAIIEGKSRKFILADTFAKIMFTGGTPQYSKAIERYHIFYNRLNTLIVGIALKLYQLEKAMLPEDLKQLIPVYLKNVPQDTFNQFNPLRYKKRDKGFIVYSFGPDRKDDQWSIEYNKDNPEKGGDIIFSAY